MNNKGFTLIELIASIVIIAMLVTIVSISIGSTVKDYKKSLSKTQISIIEEAANVYYLKEGIKNSYENRSFKLCVNLDYLIENDYIEDESIKSIYNSDNLKGSVEITYKSEYTYKYQENSCTYDYKPIDSICTAVTKETKTTGNVPKGNYLLGDEYICEVKNNTKYHFFVLNTEKDKVNLILDRNVYYDDSNDTAGLTNLNNTGDIAWYKNEKKHSNGPVTAMNYLHNATKDWNNIPNIIIDYTDENVVYDTQEKGQIGYEGIKTTGNITTITSKDGTIKNTLENVKTRLPKYSEVHGDNKCLTPKETNGVYGSCPLWLSNYLNKSASVTGEGLQNILIDGYWILSTSGDDAESAWFISYNGYITGKAVTDTYTGVRPVITIPKLDIAN